MRKNAGKFIAACLAAATALSTIPTSAFAATSSVVAYTNETSFMETAFEGISIADMLKEAMKDTEWDYVKRKWKVKPVEMTNAGTVYVDQIRRGSAVKALSAAAKGKASDVIAIAETQIGYAGIITDNGIRCSYFSNAWNHDVSARNADADGKDCKSNWCSEFAYWVLVKARVLPETLKITSVRSFRREVAGKKSGMNGKIYKFWASSPENPNKDIDKRFKKASENWFKEWRSDGTLRIADLKPGDILQICSSENREIPHHTAIFTKAVNGAYVEVIEGNKKVSGKNLSIVKRSSIPAHEIIAVIRPNYKK